jgi:hypothetical protein
VRERHLDLFSELHRDFVVLGFGDVARNLAGIFVSFAGDGSGICIQESPLLGPEEATA